MNHEKPNLPFPPLDGLKIVVDDARVADAAWIDEQAGEILVSTAMWERIQAAKASDELKTVLASIPTRNVKDLPLWKNERIFPLLRIG